MGCGFSGDRLVSLSFPCLSHSFYPYDLGEVLARHVIFPYCSLPLLLPAIVYTCSSILIGTKTPFVLS